MSESFLNKFACGLQLNLKEPPTQVFPCEYSEILKEHLFHRTLPDDCFWTTFSQAYSTSDYETPPISRVLIGRHLIFC